MCGYVLSNFSIPLFVPIAIAMAFCKPIWHPLCNLFVHFYLMKIWLFFLEAVYFTFVYKEVGSRGELMKLLTKLIANHIHNWNSFTEMLAIEGSISGLY